MEKIAYSDLRVNGQRIDNIYTNLFEGINSLIDTINTTLSQDLSRTASPTFVTLNSTQIVSSVTQTSATPATEVSRTIYGKQTTNGTALTTGTLVGVRGEANVANGCTAGTGTFMYGTQGKLILNDTSIVNAGSGHFCGIMGQIDISGGTTTSGHIACVIASIQDTTNTARTQVNGFYAELPTYGSGAKMNSVLQGVGGASVGLDFSGLNADYLVSLPNSSLTPWSATNAIGDSGKIKILINGVAKYINVYTS